MLTPIQCQVSDHFKEERKHLGIFQKRDYSLFGRPSVNRSKCLNSEFFGVPSAPSTGSEYTHKESSNKEVHQHTLQKRMDY